MKGLLFKRYCILKDLRVLDFVKDTSLQSLSSASSAILGFLQTIVLGKYLLAENYGILALIVTYVKFVNNFYSFNTWEFITKYAAQAKMLGDIDEYYAVIKLGYLLEIVTGVLAFLTSILLLPVAIKYIFHEKEVYSLILLFAVTVLFSNMDNTSNALLRVNKKFGWIALKDISVALVRLILLIVILMFTEMGLRGVISIYLFMALGTWIYNITFVSLLFERGFWKGVIKSKLSFLVTKKNQIKNFILNIYFSSTLSMFLGYSDLLVLGYFSTPRSVGIYKMSKNFIHMLNRLIEPFYLVVFPELSRLATTGANAFKNYIKNTTSVISIILIPVLLSVFIFSPIIIKYTIGNSFIEVVVPLRIMLFGTLIAGMCFWSRPAILAVNKAYIPNIVNIINVIVFAILSVILLPIYGYIGMALIYVAVTIIGNVIVSYLAYTAEFSTGL